MHTPAARSAAGTGQRGSRVRYERNRRRSQRAVGSRHTTVLAPFRNGRVMPHWADLLDLPPRPWNDDRKTAAAVERFHTLGAHITAIEPTPLDRGLLWFYSDL